MITFKQGNLLDAETEAVVNTVNTVGIMGKGIALMFKEKYPANFAEYAAASRRGEVQLGRMFVTENRELFGPKWIINFPTKTNWRVKTRIEWVEAGLHDLVRVIGEKNIRSIAVPPLGCGNGGLKWDIVRPVIVAALERVEGLDAIVFEPTARYLNVVKPRGTRALTPARALAAEVIRRYCEVDIQCTLLEAQKLLWFVDRGVKRAALPDLFRFNFTARKYGPYSHTLQHLLNRLDGSYLRFQRRVPDSRPLDVLWFIGKQADHVNAYLNSGECKPYSGALEWAADTIDGFQSPLGMELLSTVDWLIQREGVAPTIPGVLEGVAHWAGGPDAARRKQSIFDERLIGIALEHLTNANAKPI